KKSSAGKQVTSLRASASTTAPRDPSANSSHMNQKRACPGVPNKQRTTPPWMVIRPKPRATGVVASSSAPSRSSTPELASVIISSVLRGGISLTEATKVVLPVPKPPATSTFTACGITSWGFVYVSESADTIECRLKYFLIGKPGHG